MPITLRHSTFQRAVGICGLLACAASVALAQGKPIPQLAKKGDKFVLTVDGKPFIMLGGQVGNFAGYPDRMERAWPSFKAMNLNTVEYPVYWNVVEPVEGKFDFGPRDDRRIVAGRVPGNGVR